MSRKEQILAFLQDAPMDAFLHYALAQEHIKTGDQEAALGEYLWLTENHPGYVEVQTLVVEKKDSKDSKDLQYK
jgi:hypothetical protein